MGSYSEVRPSPPPSRPATAAHGRRPARRPACSEHERRPGRTRSGRQTRPCRSASRTTAGFTSVTVVGRTSDASDRALARAFLKIMQRRDPRVAWHAEWTKRRLPPIPATAEMPLQRAVAEDDQRDAAARLTP
jgi:hypothetical protein